MRFKRWPRSDYEATARKSAAILRKQRLECAAYPLFADQIAAEQPDVQHVHAQRAMRWRRSEARDRAWRAGRWRKARAWLNRYPEGTRVQLLDFWNRHRWFPADPSYLLMMLNMYDTGRLDLAADHMLTPRTK
jgi:hypothetical protein